MKTLRTLLLIVCSTSMARAQAPGAAEDPNHAELRALRGRVLEAINKGDIDAALECAHPEVVFTAMDGTVCRGRGEIKAYFDRMMKGPKRIVASYRTELAVDALTILYGGDTGVCYGSAVDHFALTDGLKLDVTDRWSCTLVKENGKWLIANFHASTSVFDNPLLNAVKSAMRWSLGLGLPLALVAGFGLGRRYGRKSSAAAPAGS